MSEHEPEGATPLEPDETDDLIPSHIRTRGELNLWEQENILEATLWARRTTAPALDELMIRQLHRRMFDGTWAWAGRYRQSGKNLGVDWPMIPGEVQKLVGDGKYWIENGTYSVDESVLRLHHRLVEIHPFPDGNGRHARLWCDMLLTQCGRPKFDWKNSDLDSEGGEARHRYIEALEAADGHDYTPLFALLLSGRDP